MKLELTDSEWMSLIDGESDDTQLGKCCAAISELRDILVQILRDGRNRDLEKWEIRDLKRNITNCFPDGHNPSELIKKISSQIGLKLKGISG